MSDLSHHSLYDDFPEYHDRIKQLKLENETFARLATEYHQLDHHVYGLERRNIPTSDQHVEELKVRRVHLKDELYQMLQL